jgi:hypothetical protein
LPPAQTAAQAVRVKQLLATYPDFVDIELAHTYLLYLDAIGEQDESNGKSAIVQLRECFSHFLIKNLSVVGYEGKTYYLPGDQGNKVRNALADHRDTVTIRYLSKMDGSEETHIFQTKKVEYVHPAPQSAIADQATPMLLKVSPSSWDRTIIRIAELVQDSPKLDPILKVNLLRQVVELGARGSHPLSQGLSGQQRKFAESKLNLAQVPWAEPDAEGLDRSRARAQRLLDDLDSVKPAYEAAEKYRQQLTNSLQGSAAELAGWLAWDKLRGWECRGNDKVVGAYMVALVSHEADHPTHWQNVGTLVDGKVVIKRDNPGPLVEGRLLFLIRQGQH